MEKPTEKDRVLKIGEPKIILPRRSEKKTLVEYANLKQVQLSANSIENPDVMRMIKVPGTKYTSPKHNRAPTFYRHRSEPFMSINKALKVTGKHVETHDKTETKKLLRATKQKMLRSKSTQKLVQVNLPPLESNYSTVNIPFSLPENKYKVYNPSLKFEPDSLKQMQGTMNLFQATLVSNDFPLVKEDKSLGVQTFYGAQSDLKPPSDLIEPGDFVSVQLIDTKSQPKIASLYARNDDQTELGVEDFLRSINRQ